MRLDALKIDPNNPSLENNIAPKTIVIEDELLVYGENVCAEVMAFEDQLYILGDMTGSYLYTDEISESYVNGVPLVDLGTNGVGDLFSYLFNSIYGIILLQ